MFAYILCYVAGVGTLILGITVGVRVTERKLGKRTNQRREERAPRHVMQADENAPRESGWRW
ncbi:MAG: hypothetical protein J6M10_10425 [Clostridia bacterium]|nr:hypothetical protein [Clostridia bacterium]